MVLQYLLTILLYFLLVMTYLAFDFLSNSKYFRLLKNDISFLEEFIKSEILFILIFFFIFFFIFKISKISDK